MSHTISISENLNDLLSSEIKNMQPSAVDEYLLRVVRKEKREKEKAIADFIALVREGEKGESMEYSFDKIMHKIRNKHAVEN